MIRVLHYELSAHLGGIETYLHKLYHNIDRKKFQFDFLVMGEKEPCWYNEFRAMGSNFYYVTPRSKSTTQNKKEIVKLFKAEKFDIFHAHLNTLSYITPVLEALKNDCKVIVHSRNAGMTKSRLTNTFHTINSYRLPKDKVEKLAVSDLAGEWLFGKGGNFQVINNGIDIERYQFNSDVRKATRDALNLTDEYAVIHIGALRPQKNHMFLLEVFNEVTKRISDAKLILAGDGDLKEAVINKINLLGLQEHVIMLGSRSDIPELLSAADAFLFPSHFEGFPNAVLEAQTTGLPCLVSDVITENIMINDNCVSLALSSPPEVWASQLLSLNQYADRSEAALRIERRGLSVKKEVETIEFIYTK